MEGGASDGWYVEGCRRTDPTSARGMDSGFRRILRSDRLRNCGPGHPRIRSRVRGIAHPRRVGHQHVCARAAHRGIRWWQARRQVRRPPDPWAGVGDRCRLERAGGHFRHLLAAAVATRRGRPRVGDVHDRLGVRACRACSVRDPRPGDEHLRRRLLARRHRRASHRWSVDRGQPPVTVLLLRRNPRDRRRHHLRVPVRWIEDSLPEVDRLAGRYIGRGRRTDADRGRSGSAPRSTFPSSDRRELLRDVGERGPHGHRAAVRCGSAAAR